jgi:hypothetical protein
LALKPGPAVDDAARFFARLLHVQAVVPPEADPIDAKLAASAELGPKTRAHAVEFMARVGGIEPEAVVALMKKAAAQSPGSPGRSHYLELSLYNARRYDEAAVEIERMRGLVEDLPGLRVVFSSYANDDVERLRAARGH